MPTFTAVELDRLLEPGYRSSVWKTPPVKVEKRNPSVEKRFSQLYISPALYATPQATPIPDSPSFYSPSPYVVNHKRRGARLLRSSSHGNVSELRSKEEQGGKSENGRNEDGSIEVGEINDFPKHNSLEETSCSEWVSSSLCEKANGVADHDTECGDENSVDCAIRVEDSTKSLSVDPEREADSEDFFDPQDSISVTSNTEFEDNSGTERLMKNISSLGEYFDACDDLSSDVALGLSRRDIEAELSAIRLNLLMEIEKRKQAEEALANMQNQWQRIVQQLSHVGLSAPASLVISEEMDEKLEVDPAEELCQQVVLARVVAGSVGRGSARAEAELVMESQIKSKNFEISRLYDKVQYYEVVNHEMSHRNQEAVEVVRRRRHIRKRRQRWIWSSIGLAITLGTAALAWSYIPNSRGSTRPDTSSASQGDGND